MIRDYFKKDDTVDNIYKDIQKLSQEELLDLEVISRVLGYSGESLVDTLVSPKGYRILSKVPRIPSNVIENLIKHFDRFNQIIDADIEELDQVEGIGEARARAIRNGLKRINEQVYLNKEL